MKIVRSKNKKYVCVDGVIYTDEQYELVKGMIEEIRKLKLENKVHAERVQQLMKRLARRRKKNEHK